MLQNAIKYQTQYIHNYFWGGAGNYHWHENIWKFVMPLAVEKNMQLAKQMEAMINGTEW